MRAIAERCISQSIHLVATYIPRMSNIGPDLSRGKETAFLNQFPEMEWKPLDIPCQLSPMNGMIEWKDN